MMKASILRLLYRTRIADGLVATVLAVGISDGRFWKAREFAGRQVHAKPYRLLYLARAQPAFLGMEMCRARYMTKGCRQ